MRRITAGNDSASNRIKKPDQKIRIKLPLFTEACDRIGVSDRGAALVVTYLLEDYNAVKNIKSRKISTSHTSS